MKHFYYLLLVAAMLIMGQQANAQIKFGLKGGLNLNSMSISKDVLDASNQAGFYVGPTVKFTLPIVGLGVDASALYDYRSAKLTNNDDQSSSVTVKQQQIAIPVNLRYGVGLGSTASVYLFAGPQFGFNVGGNANKTINWKWKDSNFSVNVGLGLMLLQHLQVNANYNIACGKTGEATIENAATKAIKNANGRNNSWQLGLAYYF